jgi:hypothetical protein
MKFPILIKKKKLFIWYSNHWINVSSEIGYYGGGVKGTYRFFKGWIKCLFGKHSYSDIFCLKQWQAEHRCHYCRKEK